VLQFNYDPTRDLRQIAAPVWLVMGENDRVFPPDIVIERMRNALRTGGNDHFTSRILSGVGHGMTSVQTFEGKPFRRSASPLFVQTLVEWAGTAAGR
jgi:pimeloyl-ACP methyl ester carboxylesterase